VRSTLLVTRMRERGHLYILAHKWVIDFGVTDFIRQTTELPQYSLVTPARFAWSFIQDASSICVHKGQSAISRHSLFR
jgi:hypothetical protein